MVNCVTLKPEQRLQNVNKLGDIYIRSVIIELVVLWENMSTKTFSTRGYWLLLFLGYLMEEIEDRTTLITFMSLPVINNTASYITKFILTGTKYGCISLEQNILSVVCFGAG